jgi:lipopolysaccharide transport system permease protein
MPSAVSIPSSVAITVIQPVQGWKSLNLAELWEARELLVFLTWRDIKVRYTQALLGIAWAVLVPFSQMLVFSLIFGRVAGLPSDGLPRPIFYYTALLPWTYFATALTMSSQSLVANSAMMTKVYFPRMLMPMASCVAGLIDLAIAFVLLLGMMLFYRIAPGPEALLLPLMVLIAFTTALGVGLLFSALNVKYRDIRYVLPFLIQVWMYGTVIIPFSKIPESLGVWRYLYGLNPMAGVVEGFRWSLLNERMTVERLVDGQVSAVPLGAPWALILIGLPVTLGLLLAGVSYFRRMERQFADIV